MRKTYFYKRYFCEVCKKEIGKVMTQDDYENNPTPKCCGKSTIKKEEVRQTSRAPFLGFAKSRGKYDIDDIKSSNAGDRNVHYSLSLMEQAGKLTPKYVHDHKKMIKKAQRQAKENGWRL